MNQNLTPTDLSKAVSGTQIETPAYNWQTQVRYETSAAGNYTSGTQQTFDAWGKVTDSTGDSND